MVFTKTAKQRSMTWMINTIQFYNTISKRSSVITYSFSDSLTIIRDEGLHYAEGERRVIMKIRLNPETGPHFVSMPPYVD